jgi:hypothetical protein
MLSTCMDISPERVRTLLAWSTVGAGLIGACTFPNYGVPPPGGGGQAGAAASTGASTQSGGDTMQAGGSAGTPLAGGGSNGGTPVMSDAGSAGDATEPAPVDIGPCGQRPHPTHCWNDKLDLDETDVDCGGPRCAPCAAEEACLVARDCSLGACNDGKCERSFSLQYEQLMPDEETASFRFKTVLSYAGKAPLLLRDVSLRYYFSRNSVTEPILPTGTVIALGEQGDISGSATWSIGRQLRGNGITNDAYLEVTFTGGKIVTEGQALEITGSATTADNASMFNQATHFSFDAATTLHESKKLAVFFKGRRAWGNGPVIDDPPSCFHLGVNLDGPEVTVDGNAWLTSPDSVLARYLNDLVVPKPSTDQGHKDMLRAGFFFHGDSFSYEVDNGTYALLAYAWSADGAETGTLKVQDEARDTFHATSFAGGGPWVALGPYRVEVTNGKLKLAAAGDLRLGGFELRLLDE